MLNRIRVIAVTHRDLQSMITEGGFREDLWFRLSGFPIPLPPVRQGQDPRPRRGGGLLGVNPTTLRTRIDQLGIRYRRRDRGTN